MHSTSDPEVTHWLPAVFRAMHEQISNATKDHRNVTCKKCLEFIEYYKKTIRGGS